MAAALTSINPATGALIAEYEIHDEKKINKAVKQAQSAFEDWKQLTLKERGAVLKKIAAQLRKDKEKLAKLATFKFCLALASRVA